MWTTIIPAIISGSDWCRRRVGPSTLSNGGVEKQRTTAVTHRSCSVLPHAQGSHRGIADHRPLQDDHRPCLVDVEDRYPVDRRAGIVARRRVGDVVAPITIAKSSLRRKPDRREAPATRLKAVITR